MAEPSRTAPLTPAELLAWLDELGIPSTTVEHPAVYTVQEAREHRRGLSGTFLKNLFLRDKKVNMWLLVARESVLVDLKRLARQLGTKHLSFGSAERLAANLGVEPGSVTPFGLVNDRRGSVSVLLDRGVLERDPVHAHPLTNTMTTAVTAEDLLRFVRATGHEPRILDLEFDSAPPTSER
jgi:Ala-tRNA(Pro) deacylase